MSRYGDMPFVADEPNVRAALSHGFESKPEKCFDYLIAGNVSRQFHRLRRTGSATK